jgi:hypothetical protein
VNAPTGPRVKDGAAHSSALMACCSAASAEDASLMDRRRRVLSPSLSLVGAKDGEPLYIHRAEGAYMFSPDGVRYLDCVNNVPVVGHQHPAVVAALCTQSALLNTNTRYLHPLVVEYAERLVATMPPHPSGEGWTVFFTCSVGCLAFLNGDLLCWTPQGFSSCVGTGHSTTGVAVLLAVTEGDTAMSFADLWGDTACVLVFVCRGCRDRKPMTSP